MEQAKIEKIAETFKDEEFAKRIIKIKEKEELIKAFAEKGLELSVEEVDGLIQKGKEAISNGEFSKIKKALSEDELENVSGGGPLISALAAANAALIIESFNVFYKHKTGSDKFDIIKLLSMVGWATIALATEFAIIKVAQEVYNKIKS